MTRRTAARRAVGATALAVVAALFAGCASIPPAPAWTPPAPAVPAVTLGDGTDGTAGSAAGGADAPADPAAAAPTAPGLDVRLLYNADPASPVAARWGEIPGNDSFTALLRGRVTDAIAAHAAATGVAYRPAADAPDIGADMRGCLPGSSTRPAAEVLADPGLAPQTGGPVLSVSCEVRAAAGDILVEALRIITAADGQVTSDETTVYYVQTSGGFITTSDTFLSDDGLRILLKDLVEALKISAGALRPEMTQSVDEFPLEQLRTVFARHTFAADGSLRITVPSDFTTPELDRLARVPRPNPFVMTVPAAEVAALLTPQGAEIQSVLASGAPLVLPDGPTRGQQQVDCGLFACVALTYDDGPGEYTDQVLDDLDARRAAATFFLQGYRVGSRPTTVQRMRDEGHEIGNHSYNHPDLTKLTDEQIRDQLERTSAAIASVTGSAPTTFRPPYGAVDQRVLDQTKLPAILWTVDTNDWQLPDDATLISRAVAQPGPGAIVLLHDVHENTARMTPAIVDGLLGRGFTAVTLEQLLGGRLPAPHTTTSHG
ncbi:polysaccharide deacetylase family protein [Herbiconiux sp. KACC 21604]|uniref:polysaccharide deacetylase family protein n=1 Tax=unclassified Herbiconiux TaxID=2618217 RepID=UPI001492BAAB|nr:polysaccharide deacetylase family protein [Herbiconiux sp. SALV-R1]QJU53174.1 polysaccharide deacetylase family protein [Herbiconiux sp. SALV-R1]WPO88121.1 polysaccharide deacetylase family protein [Herbiconiux sp. KACC 21604]